MLRDRLALKRLYGALARVEVETDDSAQFDVGQKSPPH